MYSASYPFNVFLPAVQSYTRALTVQTPGTTLSLTAPMRVFGDIVNLVKACPTGATGLPAMSSTFRTAGRRGPKVSSHPKGGGSCSAFTKPRHSARRTDGGVWGHVWVRGGVGCLEPGPGGGTHIMHGRRVEVWGGELGEVEGFKQQQRSQQQQHQR